MILITGATGKVGAATAIALQKAGIACRVLVRDEKKWAMKTDAEVVVGSLDVDADIQAALQGVDKLLLVMGNNESQGAIEKNVADLAARNGVSQIVKISSMEASPAAVAVLPAMHYEVECHIRELGLDFTFLRPNYYMQNLFMSAASIAGQSSFALPLGETQTALIDTRDLGEVAAKVLLEAGHARKTYEITGPELLDFDSVAATFSKELGKPVTYVKQSPEEFRAVLSQFIQSTWHLNAVCELFEQIRGGALAKHSADAAQILGRQPRDLATFVRDHRGAFGASAAAT